MNDTSWLPLFFICLMGLSIFIYSVLDGYDLGVGILLPLSDECQNDRDKMIASIGPFWDANETWLVLAVGLLLIAFPEAHNIVLKNLYIPATIMLIGLILRGVSFDFRIKAINTQRALWDKGFKIGSLITALAQGYMLGRYVLGFDASAAAHAFAILSALCVSAAYALIGGAWLVMKSEGELQARAAKWAHRSLWFAALGILSVSIVNPLVNELAYEKWFGFPQLLILLPIPLLCFLFFVFAERYLVNAPHKNDFGCWIPFVCTVMVFFLCFQALAYSYYPFVVPNQLTLWQAASAPESLLFIFYGAVIVVPCILAYTVFSYRVFWGKTKDLQYY